MVAVSPFSVLGTQLTASGDFVTASAEPEPDTAIVDPAGLSYITSEGPAEAGGAAAVIYKWLGIKADPAFPEPVRNAIQAPLAAKFHAYGPKKCIHVVGPDFRDRQLSRDDA